MPCHTNAANQLYLTSGAMFWLAMCASPDVCAEPTPRVTQARASASESYALPLALGYAFAPVLAGALGAGLFELTNTDHDDIHLRRNLAVATGSLMFVLPASVHLVYADPGRALRSFGSMVGVTVIGATVFGGLGYLLGKSGCDESDPSYEAEGCGIAPEALTLIGVATGASLGYVGYAIYDVLKEADGPAASEAAPDTTRLQLWLQPVAGSSRPGVPRLSGVELGGALRF
jgi:hypothetical protein